MDPHGWSPSATCAPFDVTVTVPSMPVLACSRQLQPFLWLPSMYRRFLLWSRGQGTEASESDDNKADDATGQNKQYSKQQHNRQQSLQLHTVNTGNKTVQPHGWAASCDAASSEIALPGLLHTCHLYCPHLALLASLKSRPFEVAGGEGLQTARAELKALFLSCFLPRYAPLFEPSGIFKTCAIKAKHSQEVVLLAASAEALAL